MRRACLVVAGIFLLCAPLTRAGGFLIYEHSARATGMADARTALADDVNALFFNPAAITELDGLQLELGLTGIIPHVSYTAAKIVDPDRTYNRFIDPNNENPVQINDGMNDAKAKIRAYTPIHVYASYKIPDIGLSLGLGVFNPFGMGTYWPGDFDGRFIGTESEMQTFFTQPVVALDLAELMGIKDIVKLSIAVGYDFVYGTARLSKHIDLRLAEMLPAAEIIRDPWGVMKMTGSAIGHGYNVALHAELPGWFSIGASFRSHVNLPFSGTAKFWFNAAGQQAIKTLSLVLPEETGGSVSIDLPRNMNFGVAFLGIKRLIIAVDFYIAFFSSFKEIDLHFDCADADPPCNAVSDPIPKNWSSSWQLSVGAEYEILDGLRVRAGYGTVSNPVPASTYDPSLPDGRRDLICFGAGYAKDWWKIDFGYMLAMWGGTKNNDIGGWDASGAPNGKANGDYNTITHLIAISLGAQF
jgi:long-chain fatty acid transport protein